MADEIERTARHEQRLILVVEDDEAILSSIEALLVDEGYTIVTAVNGAEALERLTRCTPRLILLDLKMPVMDGWTFAEVYRTRPLPRAPLIAMTAARDTQDWVNDIVADGFIDKPFDIEQLLELVRRHLSE